MKHRLTALAAAAAVAFGFCGDLLPAPGAAETAVYAAENTDCTVDISHAEAVAGEKVSVSISVNSAVGIGGLRLTYVLALQRD